MPIALATSDTAIAKHNGGSPTTVTTTATATISGASVTGSNWIFLINSRQRLNVVNDPIYSDDLTVTVNGIEQVLYTLSSDAGGSVLWFSYSGSLASGTVTATKTHVQYGYDHMAEDGEIQLTDEAILGVQIMAFKDAKQLAPVISSATNFSGAAASASYTGAAVTEILAVLGWADTATAFAERSTTPAQTGIDESDASATLGLAMLGSYTASASAPSDTFGWTTVSTGTIYVIEVKELPVAGIYISSTGHYKLTLDFTGSGAAPTAATITVFTEGTGTPGVPVAGCSLILSAATGQRQSSSVILTVNSDTLIHVKSDANGTLNGVLKMIVERLS